MADVEGTPGRDGFGRRRLTEDESRQLLDLPLVGVLSTLVPDGRIHSVPVHFLQRGTELAILTEWSSVKCRNAVRTGRATLCVETTITGSDRRYVMAEGTVRIERPPAAADLKALDLLYGRQDFASSDSDLDGDAVMLVLNPEQWIAWSDQD